MAGLEIPYKYNPAPPTNRYVVFVCVFVGYQYRRIPQAGAFTCRAVTQKLETQNQKEDQISTPHPPDNAESEVFSDSRRFFHDFFLEKLTLYGVVAIKSRQLEAKHLKFSPPKSLCGTVGSPWVSLLEYTSSDLILVLEDFDKIFRIDDFVW